MFTIADKIGLGVYSVAEAALYARVSSNVMARWVFGDSRGDPVIDRQLMRSPDRVVTFLDFIQTLAIREVRHRHRIPLPTIRRGVEEARVRYGIDYPLATRHAIYLLSDGKGEGHGQIVIRHPDDPDGPLVQLTGRARGNLLMRPVVEEFLQDIRFDPTTRLAREYAPLAADGASIRLDPNRRFGEPIVDPGGYTVETLWNATNAEGGIEAAARVYGVTTAEVRLANRYLDMLYLDRAA